MEIRSSETYSFYKETPQPLLLLLRDSLGKDAANDLKAIADGKSNDENYKDLCDRLFEFYHAFDSLSDAEKNTLQIVEKPGNCFYPVYILLLAKGGDPTQLKDAVEHYNGSPDSLNQFKDALAQSIPPGDMDQAGMIIENFVSG